MEKTNFTVYWNFVENFRKIFTVIICVWETLFFQSQIRGEYFTGELTIDDIYIF